MISQSQLKPPLQDINRDFPSDSVFMVPLSFFAHFRVHPRILWKTIFPEWHATLAGAEEKKTGPSRFIEDFLTELTKLSKFGIYKRTCSQFTQIRHSVNRRFTISLHGVYTRNTPGVQNQEAEVRSQNFPISHQLTTAGPGADVHWLPSQNSARPFAFNRAGTPTERDAAT